MMLDPNKVKKDNKKCLILQEIFSNNTRDNLRPYRLTKTIKKSYSNETQEAIVKDHTLTLHNLVL